MVASSLVVVTPSCHQPRWPTLPHELRLPGAQLCSCARCSALSPFGYSTVRSPESSWNAVKGVLFSSCARCLFAASRRVFFQSRLRVCQNPF